MGSSLGNQSIHSLVDKRDQLYAPTDRSMGKGKYVNLRRRRDVMKRIWSSLSLHGQGLVCVFSLCVSTLFVSPASATPISGVFSTGVDNSGNLLPVGAFDPHYNLTGS